MSLLPPTYREWILWWHHRHIGYRAKVHPKHRDEGEVLEVVFATEWWQRVEYHED